MGASSTLEGETALVVRSKATQLANHSVYASQSKLDILVSPPEQLSSPHDRASSSYAHRDLRNISGSKWSLPELCSKIPQISALDRLKIIASECYVSHGFIRHRYLLLELRHRRNTASMWMRLDRRRSLTSIISFSLASSKGPANDTVRHFRFTSKG